MITWIVHQWDKPGPWSMVCTIACCPAGGTVTTGGKGIVAWALPSNGWGSGWCLGPSSTCIPSVLWYATVPARLGRGSTILSCTLAATAGAFCGQIPWGEFFNVGWVVKCMGVCPGVHVWFGVVPSPGLLIVIPDRVLVPSWSHAIFWLPVLLPLTTPGDTHRKLLRCQVVPHADLVV